MAEDEDDDEDEDARRKRLTRERVRRHRERQKESLGAEAVRDQIRQQRSEHRAGQAAHSTCSKAVHYDHIADTPSSASIHIRKLATKGDPDSNATHCVLLDNLRLFSHRNDAIKKLLKPYHFVRIKKWIRLLKAESILRSVSRRAKILRSIGKRMRRKSRVKKRPKKLSKNSSKWDHSKKKAMHLIAKMYAEINADPRHARKSEEEKRRMKMSRIKYRRVRAFRVIRESRGFPEMAEVMTSFVYAMQRNRGQASIVAVFSRVQKIIAIANKIKPHLEAAIKELSSRLVKQVTSGVHHPRRTSQREKALRTVGRMRYHVVKDRRDDTAVPLSSFYPALHREFMKLPPEEVQPDDGAVIKDLMAEMCAEVERDLLEQQQDPAVDAYNLDAEDEPCELAAKALTAEEMAMMIEAGEDMLEQDPKLAMIAGPLGAHAITRVIRGKQCTQACVHLTADEAMKMKTSIERLDEDMKSRYYDAAEEFASTVLPKINKLAPCYSGLRTLVARFRGLRACTRVWNEIEAAERSGDAFIESLMIKSEWWWLPKELKSVIEAEFTDMKPDIHGEAPIREKHGTKIEAFKREMEQAEDVVCDICDRYTRRCQMSMTTSFRLHDDARPDADGNRPASLKVCKKCCQDARSGGGNARNPAKPRCAITNGVLFDEVPPCFNNLNWMEKALIQLVHPVRSIVTLHDVAGRANSMRGASGGMVLLPVPTKDTFDHLAETMLPCDNGLNIIVHASTVSDTKLVCIKRVLEALRWLKQNNERYADVSINEDFVFSADAITFIPSRQTTEAERRKLLTDDETHPSLLRYSNLDKQILREVHGQMPPGTGCDTYLLEKNPYEPKSVDTKHLDALCFPQHFPTGKFGFDHKRDIPITKRQLIRWELANTDRRIAQDCQALAFLQGFMEQIDLTSALGLQVRLSRSMLDSTAFDALCVGGDAEAQAALCVTARTMRGGIAYWDDVKRDLRAHVAAFGTPTFFLTLSPAEKSWPEVLEIYRMVFGNKVTSDTVIDFIAKDPFFFSRIFQHRVSALFSKVILKKDGPLGKVKHWFARVEYQHRGTQHMHCLLWVEGAPSPTATTDERIKFIDAHLSARLPDPATESELYRIITNHQMHYKQHSNTCLRTYSFGRKKFTACRFEFPRLVTAITIWLSEADTLLGVAGSRRKLYTLARRPEDTLVNDYFPAVSLAWEGNTDGQYISSGVVDVVNYVASYATKPEKSGESSRLQESLKGPAASSEAFRVLVDCLKQRRMGMLEIIDMLMGHTLHFFDADHIFINSNPMDKRDRMLRPKKDREQQHKEAEGDDGTDAMDEEACPRTEVFLPLYHPTAPKSPFYCHIDKQPGQAFPIAATKKAHQLLSKPLVPRIYWPSFDVENPESTEDFYRRLCLVFIPWRDEEKIVGDGMSYEDRWTEYMGDLESSEDEADRIAAVDIRTYIVNQTALAAQNAEMAKRRKERQKLLEELAIDDDAEDGGIEQFDRYVDEEQHAANVAAMNPEQLELFKRVVQHIRDQEDWKTAKKAIDNDKKLSSKQRSDARKALGQELAELLLAVCGTAGCGKTFVINAIANELTKDYTEPEDRAYFPAVLLAAPTGLAAVQIRGSTLHALLGLEVQHGRDKAIRSLRARKLSALRITMKKVKLLVIDELSMISNIMLLKIHHRLQEIFGNTKLFGGLNIVMFGDLLQLSPVRAACIFEPLKGWELNQVFGSVLPTFDFFAAFHYHELWRIMRQAGDQAFGDALQRLRVQQTTDEDCKLFESQVIERQDMESEMDAGVRKLIELMKDLKDGEVPPLALFGKKVQVAEFNEKAIKALGLEVHEIVATDAIIPRCTRVSTRRKGDAAPIERIYEQDPYRIDKAPHNKSKGKNKKKKYDDAQGAGLEQTLRLAVNGRVMLRRNIDAAKGLVNGVIGVLTSVERTASGEVVALKVHFDGLGEHTITKVSATFDLSQEDQVNRTQFPVVMAFAATIHKCQGLTLTNAIIGMDHFFTAGQAYVGFSRVKTLKGLHLMNFHPEKLYCNEKALHVYDRLRVSVNMQPYGDPTFDPKKGKATKTNATDGAMPATPQSKTPKPRTSSSAKMKIVVNSGDRNKRRASTPSSTPVTKRSRTTNAPPPTSMPFSSTSPSIVPTPAVVTAQNADTLAMKNTGTDCFLISAVNMMHSMTTLRRSFLASADTFQVYGALSDPLIELAKLLSGQSTSVSELRRLLGMRGHAAGDDVEEAFSKIVGFMHQDDQEFMRVELKNVITCKNNHAVNVGDVDGLNPRASPYIINITVAEDDSPGSFDELFGRLRMLDQPQCWECGAEAASCTTTIDKCSKYLIMHLQRTEVGDNGARRLLNLVINGHNAKGMTIFGSRVRLVTASEYDSETHGLNGHYLTWRRAGTRWEVLDDDRIGKTPRQVYNNLKGYVLLEFEFI